MRSHVANPISCSRSKVTYCDGIALPKGNAVGIAEVAEVAHSLCSHRKAGLCKVRIKNARKNACSFKIYMTALVSFEILKVVILSTLFLVTPRVQRFIILSIAFLSN